MIMTQILTNAGPTFDPEAELEDYRESSLRSVQL